MKKILILAAAVLALGSLTARADNDRPIDVAQLPQKAQQFIRQRSAGNQCTYSYLFNQDLPINGGSVPWHCADVPYVFHNTEMVPSIQEEGVTKLEAQIFDSVIAFARTGDPNHAGIPHWPVSAPGEERTMVFCKNTQVRCNHDAELIPLLAKHMGPMFERMMRENMGDVQH